MTDVTNPQPRRHHPIDLVLPWWLEPLRIAGYRIDRLPQGLRHPVGQLREPRQ